MSPVRGDEFDEDYRFLVKAHERELQQLRDDSKSFVTIQVLELKLAAFAADIVARIEANYAATKTLQSSVDRLAEEKDADKNRVMGNLIMPIVSGLVVSIVAALILLGLSK